MATRPEVLQAKDLLKKFFVPFVAFVVKKDQPRHGGMDLKAAALAKVDRYQV